jgi:ABC-2 type transport system ATP-binding protein
MENQTVLRLKGLTKHYGKLTAVDKLDLEIKSGQVFGILGPNGSGKTTTLGMILDVVAPSDGQYEWFDGLAPVESRKRIGSILETPCFYPYMTAVQNLRVVAHIKETPEDRIEEVLKQVNLHHRKDDKFKTYSLGMKQRLSIAAALLADPPVLILDEPTNGLDPEGIAEVRSLIKDISEQGKTIIMASHLLDEVQKVCTDFCILKNGNKLHEGSIFDLLGETNKVFVNASDLQGLKAALSSFEPVQNIIETESGLTIELDENHKAWEVNKYCFENGIVLSKLVSESKSLEQEFLKILK